MAKSKSTYVCRRCALPVCGWRGGWKHCASPYTRSCRKAPEVVERAVWEAEMAAFVAAARDAASRRIYRA